MVRNSRRPLIGVTASRRKSKIARFFAWVALWRAGGKAVFLMPGDGAPNVADLDGLIVGGGDDIGGELYGGERAMNVRVDRRRDALELRLLRHAFDRGLPVLGICRGAQMMNVFLGGTLYTDIRTMPREKTNIRSVLARKIVTLSDGSKVRGLLGGETVRVNSLHHQAVDRLGAGLEIVGRDRGGFVQAFEHPSKSFFIAVQWHPEFLVFDSAQQELFRALVRQAHVEASSSSVHTPSSREHKEPHNGQHISR